MRNESGLPAVYRSDFPIDEQDLSFDRFAPYKKLHSALRGRYILLFVLAIAGGIAGGWYGYRKSIASYRSEGLIQVAYVLPAIMQQTDVNGPMQMYEEYLESQVLLMQSKEVLGDALKNPGWRSAQYGTIPEDAETFATQLTIEHPPHTQAISVSYTSNNPESAALGVRSVIAAYVGSAEAADSAGDNDRLKVLNDRKVELTNHIHEVIEKMPQEVAPLNPNQIAMFDDLMRDYMKQISLIETDLSTMQAHGAGSLNPLIVNMQKELERLTAQTHDYAADFQKMQLQLAASPTASPEHATVMPQYQGFQSMLMELRKELDETNHRMETLQLESSSGHRRLTVLSNGDVPATTYKDHRILLAAGGAAGGALVPASLMALMVLASGRLRFSEDATIGGRDFRLLGILPKLPGRISDPVLAGIASHCIHHLRLKLQMMGRQNRRVFMVTSCCAGEGKTSLTMALGLSFAASGSKTLLIDADTIGQALSHRLHAAEDEGLAEAVERNGLDGLIKPINDKLWLLPSGQCQDLTSASLSPAMVEQLISEIRDQYDYILIDTGPILASLEASTVAMCADEVVLIVSPGQHASLVHQAWKTLKAINASVPGYVFNKAVPRDYGRIVDGSSKYMTSRQFVPPRAGKDGATEKNLFGPLVQSVDFLQPERAKNGSADALTS